MFPKASLQSRILVLVTVVTFVMMSVIVWFDSYSLQKSVEETFISQLEGMTTAINGRYEESHSFEDVQQIFDYIQYKNHNVVQLILYGKHNIIASTDRNLIGKPSMPELLNQLQQEKTLVSYIRHDHDGIPKIRLTAPLQEDGITVGAIEMLLNTTENIALINDRIQFIVIVGISSTILLLITLALIIRKLLIYPLLKIREAAISVRMGLTYKEIKLDAGQEINEVASAFNSMVYILEDRYNELQLAMETIKQTQKQLVESEKMVALGNLVAGVSHEINTPIGIGVTAASYMDEKSKEFQVLFLENKMKRSDLDEFLKTVLETTGMIQINLQRASELIRSFKQVAVDRSIQIKRSFGVTEYIKEVLVSLQPDLKKRKHQVEVLGANGIEIFNDPGAISQIVTNLIMNSVIHAYDSNTSGKILIETIVHDNQLTIRYSDDGKGMPPEVAEQIFNPFFTTNRSGGGTGLGMHIVYNLVTHSLGGSITCESKVSKGTVFIIQIPMSEG